MHKQILIPLFFLFTIHHICDAQINLDTASFNAACKQLNIENKNIVVIGEAHPVKNTYGTELFIIKNLAEKGYQNIYIEYGESEAAILNIYMKTGDSTVLNYSMARWWDGAFYKEFLKPIYLFNKEKNYGLVFKGFDFERPVQVGFLFSKWFGSAKINTIDFKKLSDYLLSQNEHQFEKNISKLKAALNDVKITFPENESQYKSILKENFSTFKQIIFNPITDFNARDKNFVKTMLQIEKEGQLNKSIIVTGNHHILFKNRFIPLLADSLPENYSVFLFPFIYSNCINRDGDKKYNSYRKFLKYLNKTEEQKPLIDFTKEEKQIIPSANKNISTILVGLYNQ